VHETFADPTLHLPTGRLVPDRDFGGQRFVRHTAADAEWTPWRLAGFECRTIGFGPATDGLAEARVVRPCNEAPAPMAAHEAELVFVMVLDGDVTLARPGEAPAHLTAGDSVTLPSHLAHRWDEPSRDLQLLDVTLPAEVTVQ
jgi:quercetin dioxygenase-like cupin family protein